MSDLQTFKARWRSWYPTAPPIGQLLRALHPELWLRIHSLPESKRYAESDEEWRELLLRQNTVGTQLLGVGSECQLCIVRYSAPGERMPERLADMATAEPEALVAMDPRLVGELDDSWPGTSALPEDYDDLRVCLYAAPLVWNGGEHDALLRAVANDRTGQLLFVECSGGRVYAPYDGGADLFFRTEEERSAWRDAFRSWLPAFPSGL